MKPDLDPQVLDTKILQKVNSAHRVAFIEKYPGAVEHCLRLLTERLQLVLDKRDGVDPSNPDTWRATPEELAHIAQAIYYIDQIHTRQNDRQ